MKLITVILLSLGLQFTAHSRSLVSGGDHAGNGGDPNEIIFMDIANNIKDWILSGNASTLNLPTGLSYEDYVLAMESVLLDYKITFTSTPIFVHGAEKLCRNFIDLDSNRQILCNSARFNESYKNNIDDIYRLIHHEFAGLAGIEVNSGQTSDYVISNQISGYLKYEQIKRLPVAPDVFIDICDRGIIGEAIAKHLSSTCKSVNMTELRSLKHLELMKLNIDVIPPNAFLGLESLLRLDLSSNAIKEIPEGVFSELGSLKDLHLRDNSLERIGPESFVGLKNLELLNLRQNNLDSFEMNIFRIFPKMIHLDLSHNGIVSYKFGFTSSESFSKLDLRSNAITEIPRDSLVRFQHVNIANNQITELPEDVFKSFKDVKYLDLSDNNISKISPNAFISLGQLETLYLRQNRISNLDVDHFKGLRSLQSLYLQKNVIETVSEDAFYWMPHLRWLELNDNRIKKISANIFSRGPGYLRNIFLRYNPIETIEQNSFLNLPDLVNLDLTGSKIQKISRSETGLKDKGVVTGVTAEP